MARPLRVEYEGAIYYVMSRGNRRGRIYANDVDRLAFLELLARACGKTGWQVYAYCLMGNHFYLVVETTWADGGTWRTSSMQSKNIPKGRTDPRTDPNHAITLKSLTKRRWPCVKK